MRPRPSGDGAASNGSPNPHAQSRSLATPAATPTVEQTAYREPTSAERDELHRRLDKADKYFRIKLSPVVKNRKRKRSSSPSPAATMQLQTDSYDERLNSYYEVSPQGDWEKLRRYKKFTVGNESIATGECILVKYDDSDQLRLDLDSQWKAKVLEVRALDTEHVYLRVVWVNRPQDLSIGRRPHHGKHELFPTNEMDIIDAMSVNGRLDLYHWQEEDEDSVLPNADQYFWRQTFDIHSRKFSDIRHMCLDQQPQNPDELILQCSNGDCREWLHAKCIAEDAVIRATEKDVTLKQWKKLCTGDHAVEVEPGSAAQSKAQRRGITAELFVKGLPANAKDAEPATETQLVLHGDDDDDPSIEPVKCLFCHSTIE